MERSFQVPSDSEHWVLLAKGSWPFAAVEDKTDKWSSFTAEVAALRGGLRSVVSFCESGALCLHIGACTLDTFQWFSDA